MRQNATDSTKKRVMSGAKRPRTMARKRNNSVKKKSTNLPSAITTYAHEPNKNPSANPRYSRSENRARKYRFGGASGEVGRRPAEIENAASIRPTVFRYKRGVI